MAQPDSTTRNATAALLTETLQRLAISQDETREAIRDRDAYRELAQETLHALADLTERYRRQADRYHALLNERREQRMARAA